MKNTYSNGKLKVFRWNIIKGNVKLNGHARTIEWKVKNIRRMGHLMTYLP